MPWQGPLTKRATAFRQRPLYNPLSTYALTPQNMFRWYSKLMFYKNKAEKLTKKLKTLIGNKKFAFEHKRNEIDKIRGSITYYDRIVAHYVRLLSGVATDRPGTSIARQAADLGAHLQYSEMYAQPWHDIYQLMRPGNMTEMLTQVPYDILDEYMRRMRHERVLGRPWRPPAASMRRGEL